MAQKIQNDFLRVFKVKSFVPQKLSFVAQNVVPGLGGLLFENCDQPPVVTTNGPCKGKGQSYAPEDRPFVLRSFFVFSYPERFSSRVVGCGPAGLRPHCNLRHIYKYRLPPNRLGISGAGKIEDLRC